mmetsp:Transcript_19356/g.43752  ORF Transcript_19356/g.43752 Transcript_19356/m.43752 type:complete len:263 (+) Transcript_19356:416-1204(+)
MGDFIFARTSAGAISGLNSWNTFFEKRNAPTIAANAPVTVEGRRPSAFAMYDTAFWAVHAAPVRNEPRNTTCAVRSMRFRRATWLKVRSFLWSMDMMLGANNFGLILLNIESRMIGMMNVMAPTKPGRSRSLEIRTSVSESLARRREKSCTASAMLLLASSMQSEKIATSSNAEFAPRPKYGFTVCAQSPRISVWSPWFNLGPTNRKDGKKEGGFFATCATTSSSRKAENCGSFSLRNPRSVSGSTPACAIGSSSFKSNTPQ